MTHFRLDRKKLKELVLYISSECKDSPDFGATALNKIIYYADVAAYIYLGKPITGDKYVRRQHGPTPKSLLPIREELVREGHLTIDRRPRFTQIQERPINLREPNLSVFSSDEKEIIDAMVSELKNKTARELSEITHQELTWRNWREGEEIPYEAFLIRQLNPISRDTMEWAVNKARKSRFALEQ